MTPWMTQNWSLRERLAALAAFRPLFDQDGFCFAETVPCRKDGDFIVLSSTSLGEDASRFYQMLYDYGWVSVFDWPAWRETTLGQALMHEQAAIEHATADDLGRVLTTCVRADRFCDGYLAQAFEAGLILRVVIRAEKLLVISAGRTDALTPASPAAVTCDNRLRNLS